MDPWLETTLQRWFPKIGRHSAQDHPHAGVRKLISEQISKQGFYSVNMESFGPKPVILVPHLYNPNYQDERLFHNHNYFELAYVYRGECVHATKENTVRLHQGDAILMNPHVLHWMYTEHPQDVVFNIMLSKEIFQSDVFPCMTDNRLLFHFFLDYFYQLNKLDDSLTFPHSPKHPIEPLIKLMVEEFIEDDLCYDSVIKAHCIQLFAYLARVYRERYASTDADVELNQTVIHLIYHMQQHLRQLSLESLAEAFHYSPSHVSRLFRTRLGKSYTEVLNSLRIQTAKSLLETTSLPMGEIADSIGVNDTSYLNKIFKKKYGLTPLQYRKQFQQEP